MDVGQHFILGHTFIMKHPHMFMRKGVSRLIEPCDGSGIYITINKIRKNHCGQHVESNNKSKYNNVNESMCNVCCIKRQRLLDFKVGNIQNHSSSLKKCLNYGRSSHNIPHVIHVNNTITS